MPGVAGYLKGTITFFKRFKRIEFLVRPYDIGTCDGDYSKCFLDRPVRSHFVRTVLHEPEAKSDHQHNGP